MAAEFVLGTVQLGLAYGAANRTGQPPEAEAVALVAEAAQAGVRWLDTAHAYGLAEERIGIALRLPECRDCSVITKISPLEGIPVGDAIAAVGAARKSFEESLAALGLDRVPVLLVHRAAHRTAWGGAVWSFLLDQRQAGRIGRIGVSVQSPAEALGVAADPAVQHIQLPINLLDWRWDEVATAFIGRPDLTVHARSIFLQGLLTCADPSLWPHLEGVDAATILAVLADLADTLGRDGVDDLCVAFVRALPWVHGVVLGMETRTQLTRNVALTAKRPLTADQVAAVRSRVPRLPQTLLNPASWPSRRTS